MGAHPASIRVADASSRTSGENAEVDGLGPTVRVVVDDTALHAPPAQLRALLAHELGHVQRLHTLRGVLWFGVIGVPAILLVLAAASRLCRGRLLEPSSVPVILACAMTAAIVLLPVENLISRRIKAEADWAALRATRDPAGMEALQRRLAITNLSNPAPPRWIVWALFDHPPVMDRSRGARRSPPGDGPAPGPPRLLLAVLFLGAVVVIALAVELGQVLDALAGAPLGVVVLHGLDQLLHEAR